MKTKTKKTTSKPKSRKAPARRRTLARRRSKSESGQLLLRPQSVPGAILLASALIALLAAFHMAHERLSPHHALSQSHAALSEPGLGH